MTGFNVELRTDGSLTLGQFAACAAAARRWSEFITADVPDVYVEELGYIDDLLVEVRLLDIDGPRQVLGRGVPTVLRKGSMIPAYGFVEFDRGDLATMEADGSLLDVLTHELGHVLGIGTLWPQRQLVEDADGDRPLYVGQHGMAAYGRILGHGRPTKVPLERTRREGTHLGHWCEHTFSHELMTGYLNPGDNPLSALTIASLRDLGYGVDATAADPYSLPDRKRLKRGWRPPTMFEMLTGPGLNPKRFM